MTDCRHIMEMLDAYALGAADGPEAAAIEEHVAECVRCWEELTKSQRTAALLALSVPLRDPPAGLEPRIMGEASRQRVPGPAATWHTRKRFRLGWPAAAGALGGAAAAALAFASFLQVQMNDLRQDKDQLAAQLEVTQDLMEDQGAVIAIAAADDTQKVVMEAVSAPEGARGEYFWSWSAGGGFIVCHGLPQPDEGRVYQAWFVKDGRQISAGIFRPTEDGGCVYPMKPEEEVRRPDGIGVSLEGEGGSPSPSGEWVLWASFQE